MRVTVPLLALAACAPVVVTPEQAADICEDRARAAQGPTGTASVGAGSDGGFGSLEIGLSSDFLSGRDPIEVYRTCVFDKTGLDPVRPPILR